MDKSRQQIESDDATKTCPRPLTLLLLPHLQLHGEFRHDQKRLPALTFLRFEDVAEDVVSDVQDVFALDAQQITDDV